MALFDDASLVVTPNGYKEGTLYSIKPTSGAGDMTVVRATTATRVNSAGLIEVVPRNLLTYSNTFTNAAWGNAGYGNIATVIANDITSPDGLMNGSKITFSAGVTQARLVQQTSVINGGIYQASIFVKYGNKNTIDFYCDAAITGLFATFNFTTKALTASGVSNTIVTELPNGWFRLQYTYTAPSATSQIGFISNIGADGFVYAYGGQAEQGTTATDYFPTTDRLNIPRLDYSNGTCPSILVEPQRTNLITYSEQLDNAAWTATAITVTANATTSPDGTTNADKLIPTNVSAFHNVYNYAAVLSGNYSFSVFVKKGGYNFVSLQDQFSGVFNSCFDLVNGTVTTFVGSANIKSYGNDWFLCSVTGNGVGTTVIPSIVPANAISSFPIFTGNGTDGIFAWGAQLEVGSYPTSYIPTTSAAVTRNADAIYKTGISALIGQTEGTVFFDADVTYTAGIQLGNSTSGGDYLNSIQIAFGASTTNVNVFNGGTPQFSFAGATLTGRQKIAIAYKSNDFALYRNGTQIQIDSSGTVPTMSAITINHQDLGTTGYLYNSAILFPTRLTNAELASLTTI
jgi:hypothetical protein